MEKKNFKTINEICDYLNEKCYSTYTNTYEVRDGKLTRPLDVNEVKKGITINSNETYCDLDAGFGLDEVVLAYVDEDKNNNIDFIMCCNSYGNLNFEVLTFDRKAFSKSMEEYGEYIENGGILGVSRWLMEEYCDSLLSLGYDVLMEIEKNY